MGLARKNTKSSGSSSNAAAGAARFVLCVRNRDYPASLELRKVYRLLRDEQASRHRLMRVIDESGEDYLYPEEYFVPIKLPQAASGVEGYLVHAADALAGIIDLGDAPTCSFCESIVTRNGSCYRCGSCGSTSGCS